MFASGLLHVRVFEMMFLSTSDTWHVVVLLLVVCYYYLLSCGSFVINYYDFKSYVLYPNTHTLVRVYSTCMCLQAIFIIIVRSRGSLGEFWSLIFGLGLLKSPAFGLSYLA